MLLNVFILFSTDQEKGLEELSKIISGSKQIGLTFHDEVNHQNGKLNCRR